MLRIPTPAACFLLIVSGCVEPPTIAGDAPPTGDPRSEPFAWRNVTIAGALPRAVAPCLFLCPISTQQRNLTPNDTAVREVALEVTWTPPPGVCTSLYVEVIQFMLSPQGYERRVILAKSGASPLKVDLANVTLVNSGNALLKVAVSANPTRVGPVAVYASEATSFKIEGRVLADQMRPEYWRLANETRQSPSASTDLVSPC